MLDIAGRRIESTSSGKLRIGLIGCGSHAFRNVHPTLQFLPVEVVGACDLDGDKAALFARQFGAADSFTDHRRLLECDVDAVLIVTNYDERGRPRYPALAADALRAGKHVWMEKPPAATVAELDALQEHAGDRVVRVGFKKMFAPANVKARSLMDADDFGRPMLATLQYPTFIPAVEDFGRYAAGNYLNSVVGFLDHLCHPVSLLVSLFGRPATLVYQRSASGAGSAVFTFVSGLIATLQLTHGAPANGGMERTHIVSDRGRAITVENNTHVTYGRDPPTPAGQGYGTTPSYFTGEPGEVSSVWTPEFSLGQLYNKALFLLGYYGELDAFVSACAGRPASPRGTLADARVITGIFEAFAEGPGRVIPLDHL